MTWRPFLERLAAYLLWPRKSGATSKAAARKNKKPRLAKRNIGNGNSVKRFRAGTGLMLLMLSMLCVSCATKPQPPESPRPCFSWIATEGQELRVYENNGLVAILETKPNDAVIAGWCLGKYNQDLTNEIRRLAQ